MNSNLVRYAAFGTAICWILSLIFFGMEFGVSLIFGTLANIASALAVLLLLVLVLFSHQLFKPHFKAASAIVTTIAVVGIFIDLLGYLRLILSPVAFSEVIIQLYVGYGLIGIWLIGIALMNVQTQILPAGLTWTGGLAGIGLVTFMLVTLLSPDSFLFGGQPTDFGSPLSLIGSLAAAIAYLAFPVWAIWMGRAVRRSISNLITRRFFMKTFLATTGKGFGDSSLALAEYGPDGNWSVEFPLKGQDVRSLAADPLNPGVVYAGTQGNGIFRSEDNGKTWKAAGLAGQIVKALAVSPHESGKIFAGTKPAYLHVSADHGQTWRELDAFRRIRGRRLWFSPAEKPFQAYVMAITVSPTEPQTIVVGIEFGAVIRSKDGGATWSNHISRTLRDCHNLSFNANDGNWVYEAGGGGASFSQDGGNTWRKKKSGLAKNYGVACAADPDRPEVWYISVAPGPGKAYGQQAEAYLYRSNGGANWKPIGWGPHPMEQMPIALVTDPDHSGHLYAGLTNGDVLFSEDFGDDWMTLPFNLGGIYRCLLMI